MSGRLDTHNPQLEVRLHKMVQRGSLGGNAVASARYSGTRSPIDLVPYMGEGSSVQTSKSVREPAGGFTVTVTDKPYDGFSSLETLYGIVEPMDLVEIRMQHVRNGTLVPIVMRGFISDVRRQETMSGDGKPQRAVVLQGQDYGKIWQILQIHYLVNYVIGQEIISGFQLFERFGIKLQSGMPTSTFVKEVTDKIINPHLSELVTGASGMPSTLNTSKVLDDGGATSLTGSQNAEGTIYQILKTYTDVGVWNEMFTEDREDGVNLVFRPTPALKIDGKTKVQPKAPDPEIYDVRIDRVINLSLSRSDGDVANFYWVEAPRFNFVSDVYVRLLERAAAEKPTILLDTYPNSATRLYGLRTMQVVTQTGPQSLREFHSGQTEQTERDREKSLVEWMKERRVAMVELNKDNVVLERGSIRMFGDENIRAGMYIRLRRGRFVALYYVVQVEHTFVAFNGFLTTATVERGLGFVERAQSGGSPWLDERVSE